MIDKHLGWMRARNRDAKNTKRAETVLHRFAELAGTQRQVESIKTADLKAYVETRLKASVKSQTINRELNEIKSALSHASEYFAALEDYRSPRAPWLEEPTSGRRQTWTDEQIAAVLRELYRPRGWREKGEGAARRQAIGDMFLVALSTGMRIGEVRQLPNPRNPHGLSLCKTRLTNPRIRKYLGFSR